MFNLHIYKCDFSYDHSDLAVAHFTCGCMHAFNHKTGEPFGHKRCRYHTRFNIGAFSQKEGH